MSENTQISVVLPDDILVKLEAFAAREQRKRSQAAAYLIATALADIERWEGRPLVSANA